MVFSARLLILEYSDQHQNLISSLLYYPGPLHKISLQSVDNSCPQTNKQTDRQTNATKNITSFAKEVIQALWDYCVRTCMNLTQHYTLTGFQKL